MAAYLEELAQQIALRVDAPEADQHLLHLVYALLVRVKGENITLSDVHDAWSVWTLAMHRDAGQVVPFDELDSDVQELDRPFAELLVQLARAADQGG
jgi:hypothetical protein